jgi:hypothetical protein
VRENSKECKAFFSLLRAQHFFADRQGTPVQGFGSGVVAHGLVKACQVVEADGGVGMLRAQRFFTNSQGAPVEGFGFGLVAYGLVKARQVVKALCCLGMLRAECLFRESPGPAERWG